MSDIEIDDGHLTISDMGCGHLQAKGFKLVAICTIDYIFVSIKN
jgi:hypothetical protein